MSSTNYVDFSVRQNKAIERALVFDGLERIVRLSGLIDIVYVGFGSVWFTDFALAHRRLAIQTMVSIEADPIVFKRAEYNRPYRTLEVVEGRSHDVIPALLERADFGDRPWIAWLDYDTAMDETKIDEVRSLLEALPPDSFLITTFSAQGGRYGKPEDRAERLEELFGVALPEDAFPSTRKLRDELHVMDVLAKSMQSLMHSHVLTTARPGGYVPAFELKYQDGTPMVTVGGYLPSVDNASAAAEEVAKGSWPGRCDKPIITPPLTRKEVGALQALLPDSTMISRGNVRALGFDLEDVQIASFVDHYLLYPSFAQINH